MKIKSIEVNWMHGWGNYPNLNILVDHRLKHDEFVYDMFFISNSNRENASNQLDAAQVPIAGGRGTTAAKAAQAPTIEKVENPDPNYRGPCYLLSQNNWPWVRYVAIANPDGDPSLNGALGGDYKLTNGRTYHSRTGWSSNSASCNRLHPKYLKSEVTEVYLKASNEGTSWAGYNISLDALEYLRSTTLWPLVNGAPVHLVKTNLGYWVPSIDPLEIVKAPQDNE